MTSSWMTWKRTSGRKTWLSHEMDREWNVSLDSTRTSLEMTWNSRWLRVDPLVSLLMLPQHERRWKWVTLDKGEEEDGGWRRRMGVGNKSMVSFGLLLSFSSLLVLHQDFPLQRKKRELIFVPHLLLPWLPSGYPCEEKASFSSFFSLLLFSPSPSLVETWSWNRRNMPLVPKF